MSLTCMTTTLSLGVGGAGGVEGARESNCFPSFRLRLFLGSCTSSADIDRCVTRCDREGASYLRRFNNDSGTAVCLAALGGMLGEKALHISASRAIKSKRGNATIGEFAPLYRQC
mmetsp:Transcript_622/g.1406  ORF Transcript_622/g.1406 Transcript_622/m.1406 type:complete len:115 (-) Transcript_622:46-390(-)